MLFNSSGFLLFFLVVFISYWFLFNKSVRSQNALLLIASYFFYGFWDWRFLFLLAFSTFLDFFTGLQIHRSQSTHLRRTWLLISVVTNLGFLGFFKYFNFFEESFAGLLTSLGLQAHAVTLNIILPVGISFYTFHGLSYVFDIYNRKIFPTTNWVDYTVFVCFFPLLVAGPIERATHLLPQVEQPRSFQYTKAVDGLRQLLWGFFKKLVIADNCAQYANTIFNDSSHYPGSMLALGALFFAFQIYGDFSGYSDIALGAARLLGFELLQNFKFPYFSRDIAEFWRRWHVSLSSWFRDYLYVPLGGSREGLWKSIRNTFIIFLVSGFWHGANWTFIVWGGLNALFILPQIISSTNRNNLGIVAQGRLFPTLNDFLKMVLTFSLTTFAWIFFRAENVGHAFSYIHELFSPSLFVRPELPVAARITLLFVGLFIMVEWLGRKNQFAIQTLAFNYPKWVRWSIYAFILFLIGMFMQTEQTPFIYFQF
jgi:D-alanyl-lipoteichoic acid acyltransferase DltB (MBOAT superfamily)